MCAARSIRSQPLQAHDLPAIIGPAYGRPDASKSWNWWSGQRTRSGGRCNAILFSEDQGPIEARTFYKTQAMGRGAGDSQHAELNTVQAACNTVQCATAPLALAATVALWNLQLTESKRRRKVRIPLSPPSDLCKIAAAGHHAACAHGGFAPLKPRKPFLVS